MKRILITFVLVILFASFASATVPGDWKGEVTIGGSAASASTIVNVLTGSTELATTTTPSTTVGGTVFGNDFYLLAFETTEGTAITFKVCGVTANTTTFSSGTHTLNLSVSKQANGVACTCAGVCTGGFCPYSVCASSATTTTTSTTTTTASSGGGGGGTTSVTTTTSATPTTTSTTTTTLSPEQVEAMLEIIDTIRDYYSGGSGTTLTPFEILDLIRQFFEV